MRYLVEELNSWSGKEGAQDLTLEEVLGGISGVLERLDTLETELSQRNHEVFESLIDMLKFEVRDLLLIRAALDYHIHDKKEDDEAEEAEEKEVEVSDPPATVPLQKQLQEAVQTAKAR